MKITDLDEIGVSQGTDKCFLRQDYLRHYARAFNHLRDQAFNLIEVGVLDGASMRVWEEYFPKATIVGIDIMPSAAHHASGRIKIEIGSQADPEFLSAICAKYPPLIFIDDGSHMADHVLFSFERVFPLLISGGCYVMEDLYFHADRALDRRVGSASRLPRDLLAEWGRRLVDDELPAHATSLEQYLHKSIDYIEMIRKAALIWKVASDVQPDFTRLDSLMANNRNVFLWWGLADLLGRHGMGWQRVASALENSLRLDPNHWQIYRWHADALRNAGDLRGARQSAERALQLAPESEARLLQDWIAQFPP